MCLKVASFEMILEWRSLDASHFRRIFDCVLGLCMWWGAQYSSYSFRIHRIQLKWFDVCQSICCSFSECRVLQWILGARSPKVYFPNISVCKCLNVSRFAMISEWTISEVSHFWNSRTLLKTRSAEHCLLRAFMNLRSPKCRVLSWTLSARSLRARILRVFLNASASIWRVLRWILSWRSLSRRISRAFVMTGSMKHRFCEHPWTSESDPQSVKFCDEFWTGNHLRVAFCKHFWMQVPERIAFCDDFWVEDLWGIAFHESVSCKHPQSIAFCEHSWSSDPQSSAFRDGFSMWDHQRVAFCEHYGMHVPRCVVF